MFRFRGNARIFAGSEASSIETKDDGTIEITYRRGSSVYTKTIRPAQLKSRGGRASYNISIETGGGVIRTRSGIEGTEYRIRMIGPEVRIVSQGERGQQVEEVINMVSEGERKARGGIYGLIILVVLILLVLVLWPEIVEIVASSLR